ncbi:MAG: cytochrome c maturation protein CcmE [Solirubrobacterales bacterium]
MDLSRKRQIRLFVALGVALALATGLIYVSFNASSEAREPSELQSAVPGKNYEMTGKVVAGSIEKTDTGATFKVSDRDGAGSISVSYEGVIPDPFRDHREIVLQGSVNESGVFVGDKDTLVTKCPSKFSEKKYQ